MTWRDNLRAASSEDGFIIAGGSGASLIPQNTNWHDNYMNSFTEDGIKIANLKDAVSQVETLPQEADTGSLYYLTTGANPGMYYYDGTQWVAVGGGGVSDFNDLTNRPQLNGAAMTGNTNITNFTGTDGTNAGAQGLVPAPAAADADKFLKSDGTWATAGGGGGASFTTLTSADYNWPETGTKTAVALWKLDPGIYYVDNGQSLTTGVKAYASDSSAYYEQALFFVYNRPQSPNIVLIEGHGNFGSSDGNGSDGLRSYAVDKGNGQLNGLYAAATHGEVMDAGISPVYPWSSEWPTNNPDGKAVFMRSGQFNFPYKTKLYLTGTYAVDNFIGRVEINQFENDNNVSVFGFRACDLNHGIIYVGQTRSDGTNEFLYTVNTTAVSTNSQSNANQNSSSSEDPGTSTEPDPGEEPGPEIPPEEPTEEPVEG